MEARSDAMRVVEEAEEEKRKRRREDGTPLVGLGDGPDS